MLNFIQCHAFGFSIKHLFTLEICTRKKSPKLQGGGSGGPYARSPKQGRPNAVFDLSRGGRWRGLTPTLNDSGGRKFPAENVAFFLLLEPLRDPKICYKNVFAARAPPRTPLGSSYHDAPDYPLYG